MENKNRFDYLIDIVDILSLAIGIQNIELNDKQITALEEHLSKQDEQYERIISLLEDMKILKKGDNNGKSNAKSE